MLAAGQVEEPWWKSQVREGREWGVGGIQGHAGS